MGGLLPEQSAGQRGGCGGPSVCVWGCSHLRLCPAGCGRGLQCWLCGDVKATCLIQGGFFSELWTGQRVQLPARGPGPPPHPEGAVALASQPIFLYLLPMAADTPSPGARGQGPGLGHRDRGTPAGTAAERLATESQMEAGQMGQVGGGTVRKGPDKGWPAGKAGPPAAGLSGWPSPHPRRHHCLGGDSLGGSLGGREVGAGEE